MIMVHPKLKSKLIIAGLVMRVTRALKPKAPTNLRGLIL